MKKTILTLACLALCLALNAQNAVFDRIENIAKTDNQTWKHLTTLTSRFGGRPIGSASYENAQEWAMSLLKSWGYDVKLEKAGELSVGFNRDAWFGRLTGEETMNLHFVTPSYTAGTAGLERGHVVLEPRTTAEFNKMKARLKGAWVLMESHTSWAMQHNDSTRAMRKKIIARNDSIASLSPKERAEKKLDINRSFNGLFYDELIEAGILGFVQAGKVPLQALHDRDVVKGNPTFDELPTVPDIKLDEEQFNRIKKLATERRQIFLEFDIRNHFKMGPVPYHNLVATIKGSKKPNEYVLVGAHLDAFDSSTGAVDDGSGISALLEAARMLSLAGAKPERTIMFVLFAGEEFGLVGSKAFVAQHADILPKVSNLFNRDGGPLPYVAFYPPKSMEKEFEGVAKRLTKLYPNMPFSLTPFEPIAQPTRFGGTDATTFAVKGVPTIQMQERTDPLGYNFDYREIWHTERDILNQSIQVYQEQAATALAMMILQTANASKLFPRNEVYKPAEEKK